ncbi:hypothetical protein, partial [Oceanibaculum nanhaiense]|uniref:hypothetical protein n=1 Tax=Oceanibaculum nanhaiense TaxID=1909734 RepID=UPI00396EB231
VYVDRHTMKNLDRAEGLAHVPNLHGRHAFPPNTRIEAGFVLLGKNIEGVSNSRKGIGVTACSIPF